MNENVIRGPNGSVYIIEVDGNEITLSTGLKKLTFTAVSDALPEEAIEFSVDFDDVDHEQVAWGLQRMLNLLAAAGWDLRGPML